MFSYKQQTKFKDAISRHGMHPSYFEFIESQEELRLTYLPEGFYFRATTIKLRSGLDIPAYGLITYRTPDYSTGVVIPDAELTARASDWPQILLLEDEWLTWIKQEYYEQTEHGQAELEEEREISELVATTSLAPLLTSPAPLAHLHLTIQQAASSLYATGHYRQAIFDAYVAMEVAVRDKSQLAGSGTKLMEMAFSPGNPVLKIGDSVDEQQGFLSLFRGAMLAIRNPKAHSLGGTHDAQRALEWLSFASVLLRNLDEAVLAQPPATP